jgi:Alkylmercury lyase
LSDDDLELLRRVLRNFASEGCAPDDCDPAALRRLHDDHRLVLTDTGRIRMAHPFSGVATDVRVIVGNREWYGNCAWDGLGILAALGRDGIVVSHCPDCGDEAGFIVNGGAMEDCEAVVNFQVPAARWWNDIVLTWDTIRLFRSEEHAPADGANVTAWQMWELARLWYGDRLDPDWTPRTPEQSQAILDRVGLRGPFWALAG